MSDTLLLADDSVTMQRVVELTFAAQGLKVVSVSDGQQAVDHITRKPPALALVSVTLPKVNGFEVARFVRDHVEGRVPVLLLAGAFDNLNEAQVRASGAAGVLVKPFEPAVVIKRVKELLGMKSEPPRPAPVRPPASSSGRLVTSSEGPVRAPHAAAAASQAPAAPAPPAPPPAAEQAWEKLRDESGLGGAAASVEGPGQGGDYLDHLDAAFDSLDAQLAGRPAPAGRATNPAPAPSIPAAIDPGRRPAPPRALDEPSAAAASAAASGQAPVSPPPEPIFEVDDNWFDKKPAAAESLGDLTEFVVTRAGDFASTHAPAAADDRSWLPASARGTDSGDGEASPLDSARNDAHESPSPYRGSEPAPGESNATVVEAFTAAVLPAVSAEGATSERVGPAGAPAAPAGAESSDAFARLWAQEQGEPVPPPAPPPPIELNQATIDALTSQLTDRVAARIEANLAERLTTQLPGHLTNGIADRLSGAVADRLVSQLPGPLVAGVSDRIAAGLAERISGTVADRVTATVTERVTSTVTDRIGGNLAQLAQQVTAGLSSELARATSDLAPRMAVELVPRLAADLAARVTTELTPRIMADLTARVASELAPRLSDEMAARVVNELVARLAPAVAERLTASLGERLAAGLTERVAELVAERALQGALGDSLRDTVHDVAERVVRAEIERIKSAAARP